MCIFSGLRSYAQTKNKEKIENYLLKLKKNLGHINSLKNSELAITTLIDCSKLTFVGFVCGIRYFPFPIAFPTFSLTE